MGKIKIRKAILLIGLAAVIAAVAFFLRGPYVSNLLAKILITELSSATGRQVSVGRISVNMLPLFVEAREITIPGERGEIFLFVPRVKGYIDISGLLKKELVLRRLVLKEPSLQGDEAKLREIIEKVKEYLAIERKPPIKVVVRAIVAENGSFDLAYKDAAFKGSGFGIEAVLKAKDTLISKKGAEPRINFSVKEISSLIKGMPELKGDANGSIIVKEDAIDVKSLQLGFYGSKIDVNGVLSEKESRSPGRFDVRLSLLVDSFKKAFGLNRSGEGSVTAKGTISLVRNDILRSLADIEIKGDLHIQTLLELFKVDEKIEGLVDFSGRIKGPLDKITGIAKARMRKGNIYGVDIDDMRCNIEYREKMLHFKDGRASLYRGTGEAEVDVSLRGDKYFFLDVKFSDVDSPPVFKLIGWDPGIPLGKVKGELNTSGTGFNPSGSFSYESISGGKDILGRVKKVKGSFRLYDNILNLAETEIMTDKSTANVKGTVDIDKSNLLIEVRADTADLTDITLPYLQELKGSGEFSGTISGKSDNPVIGGRIKLHSASYEQYVLGEVAGDVSYKRDLLEVKEMSSSISEAAVSMKGSVRFPEAKELFDLKKPLYDLSVTAKNGDLEKFAGIVYKKPLKQYPAGRFDAAVTITGKGPEPLIKGSSRITGAHIDSLAIDSVSLTFSYDYHNLVIEDAFATRGDSTLNAKGSISADERFSLKAADGKLYLKDIPIKGSPPDAFISYSAKGEGTLNDPRLDIDGVLNGGKEKGTSLGEGKIKASIKENILFVDAAFFNGQLTLTGKASIRDRMPWTARLDVKHGRYDALISPFFKEVPEGLLVTARGFADMTGDKSHFSAKGGINRLNMTFYGYSFSNDTDLRFEIKDRKIFLPDFRMRSGSASFRVSGNMEVGKTYDLVLEGGSDLSVLKGFSKKIDVIRGDSSFVFAVTGKWDDPRIDGGVTVSNSVLGIKDVAYRVSAINGYLYMDQDRIIIQKLSGKTGGGDIEISGIAYLQGFKVKRFYIDGLLNNIEAKVSREFPVNFNGNILYKGNLESQTLSGEIRINRAYYKERVEWKSWLLKAKVKEKPKGELGAFDKTALNVRVYGEDNITIDNNIARASLKVDMQLRGTVSHPILFGRVESETGKVYFRNNEFRIISASADFSDPKRINPVMEIVAETSIKGYNIRLNLEGQMERFTLSLVSDPPLEEMDILSLLTVGKFGKELAGLEGGIGAGEATSFLTGKVQDVVEERLRSITGLDRLEVDPYVSKTKTTAVSPRVTVSKRLLGDKLFVTYSSAVGSTEAYNVVKLEYILSKSISLIGIRDERGSLGSDIKFRLEFK